MGLGWDSTAPYSVFPRVRRQAEQFKNMDFKPNRMTSAVHGTKQEEGRCQGN